MYLKNDHGSYTRSPGIYGVWITLLVFFGLAVLSMLYTYVTNKAGLVMVILILSTLVVGAFYLQSAARIYKWRQSISQYLDEIEEVRSIRLTLTETTLTLKHDEKETIEKWAMFRQLIIEKDYLILRSDADHVFMRSSMSPEEFEFLTRFASERINQPA